jgi:hypothetical protein
LAVVIAASGGPAAVAGMACDDGVDIRVATPAKDAQTTTALLGALWRRDHACNKISVEHRARPRISRPRRSFPAATVGVVPAPLLPHESLDISRLLLPFKASIEKHVSYRHIDDYEPGRLEP